MIFCVLFVDSKIILIYQIVRTLVLARTLVHLPYFLVRLKTNFHSMKAKTKCRRILKRECFGIRIWALFIIIVSFLYAFWNHACDWLMTKFLQREMNNINIWFLDRNALILTWSAWILTKFFNNLNCKFLGWETFFYKVFRSITSF